MNKQEIIYSLDEMPKVVDILRQKMADYQVFTFTGTLGTGKTTLIQALLRSCGISGHITSPTFTYVNLYENDQGQTFYHFDLYRIHSIDEFINAGFNEYLYAPQSWCFIEWPEAIMPLLDHKVCHISLEYHDQIRKLTINCID